MGECTVVLVGGNNGGKENLLQELLGRRQGGAWCYSYRHITYDLRLLPLCALQSPALRGSDCTVLVTPALDLQRALAALPALGSAVIGWWCTSRIGVPPGGAVLSLTRQRCLPGWGARSWWPPLTAAVGSIGCWLRWTGWYIFRRCPIPWGIRISKRYWRQRCTRGIVCAHSVGAGCGRRRCA